MRGQKCNELGLPENVIPGCMHTFIVEDNESLVALQSDLLN